LNRFHTVQQVTRVEGHCQVIALEVSFDTFLGPTALGSEHSKIDTTLMKG
jgi:hypothetical protein